MERTEYPGMLSSLQPSQAVAILNDRIRHVSKTNQDIGDWLQERRKLEEQYVAGLRKLARKTPPDESSDLGIFFTPWQKIVTAAEAQAEAHHNFSRRIEQDIEKPLREYASHSREMQNMTNIQGNLGALAKEYDSAHSKADRNRGKSTRRADNVEQDIENASSQWDSQAPYVFEQLQAVDESRLNHLRDVLTQLQTHELDQVEKNRVATEQVLNSLLGVNTADEIKAFSLRNAGGGGGAGTSAANTRPRQGRRQSRVIDNASSLAPPATSDTRRPPSSTREDPSSTLPPSAIEPKKSRFSGLKRMTTVLNRRKSYVPGTSPSKNKKASRLGSSTDLTETPFESTQLGRDESPLPPVPRIGDSARPGSSDRISTTSQQRESPSLPSGGAFVNGVSRNETVQSQQSNLPRTSSLTKHPQTSPMNQNRAVNGLDMPQASNDPISQAQAEAAGMPDQPSNQFKVDIKQAPIAEEGPESQSAMANVANTLKAQAPPAPSRRLGTQRGRRDVRNTMFVPSSAQPDAALSSSQSTPSATAASPSTGLSSPTLHSSLPIHRPLGSEDHSVSDNQSVRSARSLTSSSGGTAPIKHPDMQNKGLGCSIVETVSATIEQGVVARALVVGELALAHNPSQFSTKTKELIRLENFQVLEKVAPNPAFIQQPLADRPGEYALDLAAIGGSKPQVAFKYRVHVDDASVGRHAPLLLSANWKVESGQASAIVNYALNPGFVQSGSPSSSVTLHNVTLILYLGEGAGKATSCQSKPSGTFSKERNLIYWKLDEVTLNAGATPQKVLARFITDGEAKPGKIEARWELSREREIEAVVGSGLAVSSLGEGGPDPFSDALNVSGAAAAWKEVTSKRKLMAGSYVAS